MAIEEARLSVRCDECDSLEDFEMEWRFHSYNEASGHYSYEATLEKLTDDGWDFEDERHVRCPDCCEEAAA